MRSPSFAGYFASRGGAVSLPVGKETRTATNSHKKTCGELQLHLQEMVTYLREEDSLKMAVRIESQLPDKKRYLTAVTNSKDQCILIGVDWDKGPTIGTVLELHGSTVTKLGGDGGFHVSYETEIGHYFKPVSVQTLWSAIHIIQRGIDVAKKSVETDSYREFTDYYKKRINSDPTSISEWNMMDDLLSTRQFDLVLSEQEQSEQAIVKKLVRSKLKEVMIRVDIDEITCRQIRIICEDELGMDLSEFKSFLDIEMFTILGQMDSASKIFDYLYLGSEWNASDLPQLQALGIGYILNLTREIDNFFPDTFHYCNIRVYDEEDTELLQYWDRTYRFIHNARLAGSKVLVHCRRGISRSASSVIAYIMKSRGWSLTESMEYVKKCRSIIEPNAGFQKQLIIYEGILNSSRHRHSDLFRQRSKSEMDTPSTRDRRKVFRDSKLHGEIDEADEERTDGGERLASKSAKRPKSWTPDVSKEVLSEQEKRGEIVNKIPSAIDEISCQNESIPDDARAVLDGDEVGNMKFEEEQQNLMKENADSLKGVKVQRHGRRRIISRAKTLPSQLMTHLAGDTGKEGSSSSSAVEDAKDENLLEQAVAASVMKSKMLRSLEQLQGLRKTKEILDNQFSVESIIRPSSLRKASFSRRLPFERTKSFSEEAESSSRKRIRNRAYTIGVSRYCEYDDDNAEQGDELYDYDHCDEVDRNDGDCSKGDRNDGENGCSGAIQEEGQATVDADVVKETNIEGSTAKEEDKGSAENASPSTHGRNDAENQPSANDNVIEVPQFIDVKESKKLIEEQEKMLAQRVRILRCPRRHTIGESKIWNKIVKEEGSCNQQGYQKTEADGSTDDGSENSRELKTKSRALNDGVLKDKSKHHKRSANDSKLQKNNSFSGGIVSKKGPNRDDQGHSEPGYSEQASSHQDVSVKKLVQKHAALIQQTSPPGNSETPTIFFDDASFCVATVEQSLLSNSPSIIDGGEVLEDEHEEQPDTSKPADIVERGIVKRHSQIFSKAIDKALDSGTMTDSQGQKEGPARDNPFDRSKRRSVKERLQEIEGSQRNQRPISLNLEKGTMPFDTESVDSANTENVDSKTSKEVCSDLCPTSDCALKALSAPPSPNPTVASRERLNSRNCSDVQGVMNGRSSSMNDVAQYDNVAKCSHDVFVSLPGSETPGEAVKSLVDRFEGNTLAS
ncbi:uncharacterized protein LOC135683809 isoform X2 [Rhopilema esculentum]